MNALSEARRRYGRDIPDLTPHTAGADDPDVTPEQISGMIQNVFHEGHQRREKLDELAKRNQAIEHLRDGTYWIKYSHIGTYADFSDRANHAYLKDKYPWLHSVSEGLGFDEDEGEKSHGDFETFLASIPHEDWTGFLEDMDTLEDYPLLDEEGASELEMKEVDRWVTEDGGPDLIKEMVKLADNAYDAYLLNKVPVDKVFEWMREADHYPEAQGQGDVWMDMDKFAKEEDTRDWFLDEMEDDQAGWLEQKKLAFEDGAGKQFDDLLKKLAGEDEQAAHVYNHMDAEDVWQMFLQTFPDERRQEDDPYWYLWKPQYDVPGLWKPGYAADKGLDDWKSGYAEALDDLMGKEWFRLLVRNWHRRGPEGHPEFKFEAQEDPDDPGIYMKYGGGLAEEVVYEDDRIRVLYPRNYDTLNYHLLNGGQPQIDEQAWRDLFKYNDIFIIQGKEQDDMLGHAGVRELGVVIGDTDIGLRSYRQPTVAQLLNDPNYGRSIRRMLLRHYRETASRDEKAATILLQLGGARELRRAERHGHLNIKNFGVPVGLFYISKHKYRLAAKAFNRSIHTLTPQGVWLVFDSVEDLTSCFKNEDAATTVFAHDHHDWFDHYYEKNNLPKVEDVIPFLDQSAIQHLREVLVNRQVWFPDGGPDEKGEYVVLTPKVLADYDDATILDWLAHPSDEDENEGVFDDIIEAIQYAGVDILTSASQDSVYTGYVEAAVNAIDGKEHKWTTHPTKKYKSGEAMEAFKVFVPWKAVTDWAEKYQGEHGNAYDGALESLAVDANADTADPSIEHMEAGWRDVNKDWAKENLHRIHDLTPPDPIPGSPDYLDPAQTELPIKESAEDPDDPSAMSGLLSGIPIELEQRVKAVLADSVAGYGYQVSDLKFELTPYVGHSEEDIDASDGRLFNLPPHQQLRIAYQTDPETGFDVQTWVFRKVREQVINTLRWYEVKGAHMINPQALNLPDNHVVLYFTLWPVKKTEPAPAPGEEIPF